MVNFASRYSSGCSSFGPAYLQRFHGNKNGTHQLKSLMILLISCCGIIKHGIKKLWHFQLSTEWCANVMLVMHHLKKKHTKDFDKDEYVCPL